MIVWRIARTVGYTGIGVVGSVMVARPSEMVEGQMGWMTPIWATMLLVGGLSCAWAMVSRVWAGETLGLPLVFTGLFMWGCVYLRVAPFTTGRFAIGTILLCFSVLVFAHWREVYKFVDESISARLYEKKRLAHGEQ